MPTLVSASRSSVREAFTGTALVVLSLVVSFLGAELAARTFGSDEKRWEFRNFVSDPRALEGGQRTMQYDPQLGYAPRPGYSGHDQSGGSRLSFDEHGLRTPGDKRPRPAGPASIVVVGNSFAMGEQVADHETWPAHLESIADRRVLNGAVLGYGIDQIVLRAERLVPSLRPDVLLVSLIADDVRRAGLEILWGRHKPYFDVVENGLALRNVPVQPLIDTRPGPVRRVLGYSFLIDVIMRRLGLTAYWLRGQPMHFEVAHGDEERVACLLMERLQHLARTYGTRVIVVAQYTPGAWLRDSTYRFEKQIVVGVLACARQNLLEIIDTDETTRAAVRSKGVWHHYFNEAGGHMTDAGNRLIAQLIDAHLKGRRVIEELEARDPDAPSRSP